MTLARFEASNMRLDWPLRVCHDICTHHGLTTLSPRRQVSLSSVRPAPILRSKSNADLLAVFLVRPMILKLRSVSLRCSFTEPWLVSCGFVSIS